MATADLEAVEEVILAMNYPITVAPGTYANTQDKAERALPLPELREMEDLSELRHRTIHGDLPSDAIDTDQRSPEPAEVLTPSPTEAQEQSQGKIRIEQ